MCNVYVLIMTYICVTVSNEPKYYACLFVNNVVYVYNCIHGKAIKPSCILYFDWSHVNIEHFSMLIEKIFVSVFFVVKKWVAQ